MQLSETQLPIEQWSLLANLTVIMGETIKKLFSQSQEILSKLNQLDHCIQNLDLQTKPYMLRLKERGEQKWMKPSNLTYGKCNYKYEKNKIVLEIDNRPWNRGRWGNRQQVITAISQLSKRHRSSIDLKDLEYLWKDSQKRKLILTFYKSEVPDILRAKSLYLASFDIYTLRAFTNTSPHVLSLRSTPPISSSKEKPIPTPPGETQVSTNKEQRVSKLSQLYTSANQQLKATEVTLPEEDLLNPVDPQSKFQNSIPQHTISDPSLVPTTVPKLPLQAGERLNIIHMLTPCEAISHGNPQSSEDQQVLEVITKTQRPPSTALSITQTNFYLQIDKLLNEFRNSLNTKKTLLKDSPWLASDCQNPMSLSKKSQDDMDLPNLQSPTPSNSANKPTSIHKPKPNNTKLKNGSIFHDHHLVLDQLTEQD